ncbi:hypothetical protein [Alterisphingorhabdus coralli]|uniref:Uncharacterized protein n=1 Tax=Alterisphingorhabdus coralli TaxID=3071408 RepID=A0AA97I0R3_9SPHN|nr:hypothetical protein [Parasphingorhabdus sp. SCSIO 66989]WOE74475.1 hypothetical protein RB602_11535 [Parasphingorhabdus sp. SCSIO 66989]
MTIALDDALHRKARVLAAEQGLSLSGLVKLCLEKLIAGDEGPDMASQNTVKEQAMPFNHAQSAPASKASPTGKGPEGQPYFVDGKWVFTPDGKPRQPGALRGKIGMADDFDEWPEDILASFEAWPYDDDNGQD